ncbi:MAG: arginyltransferase [Betaproteobacteria bacterium TMED82]|nr:MAG: arginyltransferase [Betaproteobacteria bacterium TMED82]|tara:strand:+ start:6078 stop:6779 length:702 start_codon:yes stop_codon:yes gene_type:complete
MQHFQTPSYTCSYLNGKEAKAEVICADRKLDAKVYTELVESGFRRSGKLSYRPNCEFCNECVPIRLNVHDFKPNKTQRKTFKKLSKILVPSYEKLAFFEEHFALYKKYQVIRHPSKIAVEHTRSNYIKFVLESNVESEFIAFRNSDGKLIMMSIFDVLIDGISSVYTFYDPECVRESLGTYGILWQIEECRIRNKNFLYLGYWIKENKKMSYKNKFKPYQILVREEWRTNYEL